MLEVLHSDLARDLRPSASTGDCLRLINEAAIISAIRNIILINPGERPFNPDFGAGVAGLLFELSGPELRDILLEKLREQITIYEPRVILGDVRVIDDYESNALKIFINVVLPEKDKTQEISLTVRRQR